MDFVVCVGYYEMASIEHPMKHIKNQIGLLIRDTDNPPTAVAQLREALQQARDVVTSEMIQELVHSIPQRLRAAVAASGAHTGCQFELSHWFNTKMPGSTQKYPVRHNIPYPACISCHCHYQTPTPPLRNIVPILLKYFVIKNPSRNENEIILIIKYI